MTLAVPMDGGEATLVASDEHHTRTIDEVIRDLEALGVYPRIMNGELHILAGQAGSLIGNHAATQGVFRLAWLVMFGLSQGAAPRLLADMQAVIPYGPNPTCAACERLLPLAMEYLRLKHGELLGPCHHNHGEEGA